MNLSTFAAGKAACPVLVRAYGDRPVGLVAKGVHGSYVAVGKRDSEDTIGFPRSHVYQYEDETYRKLTAAYERGQMDEVSHLWRLAAHWA